MRYYVDIENKSRKITYNFDDVEKAIKLIIDELFDLKINKNDVITLYFYGYSEEIENLDYIELFNCKVNDFKSGSVEQREYIYNELMRIGGK